jgi:hypothetical protein
MANTTIPVELSSTPGIVDNSNATAITIDSSERVIVGNTSPFTADSVTIDQGGFLAIRNTSASGMEVRRDSTDGSLIDFQKGGSPVGSIGTIAGYMTAGTSDTGVLFHSGEDNFQPWNVSTNAGRDAAIDLGVAGARFKNLYLSGGVVFDAVAGNATSNTLDDYEEGTWTLTITTTGTAPSVSIANTTGTYTKIGRQVTCTIYTDGMNISSAGSGSLRLGGLPFSCSGGNSSYAVPSFGHTNCFASEAEGYVAINNNYVIVTQVNSIANNSLVVANPRYMMMTVTYFTDQ